MVREQPFAEASCLIHGGAAFNGIAQGGGGGEGRVRLVQRGVFCTQEWCPKPDKDRLKGVMHPGRVRKNLPLKKKATSAQCEGASVREREEYPRQMGGGLAGVVRPSSSPSSTESPIQLCSPVIDTSLPGKMNSKCGNFPSQTGILLR